MLRKFSTQRHEQLLEEFDRRARGAFVLVLAVFALLIFRLWSLQFAERDRYLKLAQSNYLRTVSEPALRGRILDRSGRPLADNVPVYDLVVNWLGVPRKTQVESIKRLSRLLGVPAEEIQNRLKAIRPSIYGDQTLEAEVYFERMVAVREAQIPGVEIRVRPMRRYPYGSAACHLIGFLGEVSEEELQRYPQYRMGDWIGKMGLERQYEFRVPALKGRDGFHQVQVHANGLISNEIPDAYEPSVPGRDIWTTLDIDLQLAAERILGSSKGAIVAMDPCSGDILAMVSRPSFDPNVFVGTRRVGERLEALRNQYNHALNGVYAIGSVFKTVMATAALEEGVVRPSDQFTCTGRFPIGDQWKHCHIWWKYHYGHGAVDLATSLERSCDVYFYNVGFKLGYENIVRYARDVFGLIDPPKYRYRASGEEEPFSLVGEEADPGRVLRARLMRGPSQWFPGDTLNLAIGQGELAASPLQVAVMMSVMATGGRMYQPRLVTQVTEQNGQLVSQFPPKLVSEVPLRPTTVMAVKEGLRRVVSGVRGTAHDSRVVGLDVLGKTGTAEKTTGETDAWYACFAPGDATAEIALAIVLPDSGHGGDVAAPLSKDLLEFYFRDRLKAQLTQAEATKGQM